MREESHISEQFLDHLDTISGLAYTLEEKRGDYEETVEKIQGNGSLEDAGHDFKEISMVLESVFDEIDALDQVIGQADMEVLVEKGGKHNYIDIDHQLKQTENGYEGLDKWKDAVVFAYQFNDDQVKVLERNLSVAGTIIQHYETIRDTYTKLDKQFDWIIGTETKARKQITQEKQEIQPPIYSLLHTKYDPQASKLNTEV